MKLLHIALLSLATMTTAHAETLLRMQTSLGPVDIALYEDKAPNTVANFLAYVDEGFYQGTIFHRVINNFMIQGGGFTADFQRKKTRDAIPNEADNGLQNARGTLAMARTGDPHSATAQFFINHVDNAYLNHSSKTPHGWGYTVFGKVVAGMDVVDTMASLPTGPAGPFRGDVPQEAIVIQSIERLPAPAATQAPAAEQTAEQSAEDKGAAD